MVVIEAALAAHFPFGKHLVGDLTRHFDHDEKDLLTLLDTMATNGQVFTARNEDGELEYSLTPFGPGGQLAGEITESFSIQSRPPSIEKLIST